MHRDAQRLGTMYMGKTWRIPDDGICNKRFLRCRVGHDARVVEAYKHLAHHPALPADIAAPEGFYLWEQARVANHVRHEIGRVATNREELKARLAHEIGKSVMCGETNAVATAL